MNIKEGFLNVPQSDRSGGILAEGEGVVEVTMLVRGEFQRDHKVQEVSWYKNGFIVKLRLVQKKEIR